MTALCIKAECIFCAKKLGKTLDIRLNPWYNIITVKETLRVTGQDGKGEKMDIMTDKQMEVILTLVADKFANCKDMEEVKKAIEEVKAMAKKDKPNE